MRLSLYDAHFARPFAEGAWFVWDGGGVDADGRRQRRRRFHAEAAARSKRTADAPHQACAAGGAASARFHRQALRSRRRTAPEPDRGGLQCERRGLAVRRRARIFSRGDDAHHRPAAGRRPEPARIHRRARA